jgi:hypothetical protein
LLLHTLFYSAEVRTLDVFCTDTDWVAPQELEAELNLKAGKRAKDATAFALADHFASGAYTVLYFTQAKGDL